MRRVVGKGWAWVVVIRGGAMLERVCMFAVGMIAVGRNGMLEVWDGLMEGVVKYGVGL